MKMFLTYAWSDRDAADRIEGRFSSLGIEVVRDTRLPYKANLTTYMRSIGEHEHAVAILSDAYFRSENCMHEALTLLDDPNFERKILPVYVDGTCLFDADYVVQIVAYWEARVRSLNEENKKMENVANSDATFERIKKVTHIRNNVDRFISRIVGMKIEKISDAESSGYRAILEYLGIDSSQGVSDVLKVRLNRDLEQQLVELKRLRRKYPNLIEIDYAEAQANAERGDIRLGISILADKLAEHPDNASLQVNYGVLQGRAMHFDEAAAAYKAAIKIRPDFGVAYYNLGVLQYRDLKDYVEARKSFEKALELMPNHLAVINNFATLLLDHSLNLPDFKLAKELLQAVLASEPDELEPYINYATLLDFRFKEHDEAKRVLNQLLLRHPDDPNVHESLGIHAMNIDNDQAIAEKHFRKAVDLQPMNPIFNHNLGRLLFRRNGHDAISANHSPEAFIFLKRAVELDPVNAEYNFWVFLVLRSMFLLDEAKSYYEAASGLDPTLINPATDGLFQIKRS